ncbi:deoxyribose-phosphate aldolase [Nesterenkonia sp. CL21]|uniref:Cgl0159 family (beta/alpha)8-fold protein n=1 Tax=Nesterenkonia sp. CL21 TaxID=3064894 RepID=UPI00287B4C5B|nr:deoxyribose-phosphate aldolase [Nesterenkonia sp. CL21]MDS2173611.1 deoxyribose-phosphate aldolase [Nesterenkonia sp. CL21]
MSRTDPPRTSEALTPVHQLRREISPPQSTSPDDEDPRRYEPLTRLRLEHPESVAAAAQSRRRHPGPVHGRQSFIIAADHAARGALAVKSDPQAMADRRRLLDRLRVALAHPKVDGVLASPDVLDDLLLLGALDGKLIFGSMNRAGLPGLVNEIDDRFTGHTASALRALGADGGKMLTRIAFDDAATTSVLESTAQAVDQLHADGLIAMVEPFISRTEAGRVVNDLSTEAVIQSVAIAQGLGASSARTWMKLPVVEDMERVMAATTLPTVLLGGDPSGRTDEVLETWRRALALPGVQGLTVGRTLLYPDGGDVAAAVDAAASLLNDSTPGGSPDATDPAPTGGLAPAGATKEDR